MLEKIPTQEELRALLGNEKLTVWNAVCAVIDSAYEMERLWADGGKRWVYEYKYRRGGKTLCALYAKENCFGLLIVFGKAEREKFEADRASYSGGTRNFYDAATTYHDGKWVMMELNDALLLDDIMRMLSIKRKPNRKNVLKAAQSSQIPV